MNEAEEKIVSPCKQVKIGRPPIHGFARQDRKTPEFKVWLKMRQRCFNKRHKQYPDYGGRGITICERWSSFPNFLSDMGERPTANHSIDRYPNNDGNYEPGNCRWATRTEQCNNRRSSRIFLFEGRSLTMAQWAASVGAKYSLFKRRIQRGHSIDRVMAHFRNCPTIES